MKTIFKISIIIILLTISTVSVIERDLFTKIGNYRLFYIESDSMKPNIMKGSIIVSRKATNVSIGDVITFQNPTRPKKYVTHRLIGKDTGTNMLITKGDNNNTKDPWMLSDDIIYGKVIFKLPLAGYVIKFTQKPLGMLLVFILPLGYLLLNYMSEIGTEIKNINFKKRKYSNVWLMNDSENEKPTKTAISILQKPGRKGLADRFVSNIGMILKQRFGFKHQKSP